MRAPECLPHSRRGRFASQVGRPRAELASAAWLGLLGALAVAACHVETKCDDDQVFDRHRYVCIPGGSGDGGEPDEPIDGGLGTTDAGCAGGTFLDPCATGDDCGCGGATFCAVQPGIPEGFCTQTGCLDSGCPEGLSCFDISGIDPELGSLCIPGG